MSVKRNSPPAHKGLKMSSEAEGEFGQPRTCTECGETKEVTHRTFTPSKRGVRGWHTVCRSCVGKSGQAAAKAAGLNTLGGRAHIGRSRSAPKRIDGFDACPIKEFEAFGLELDAKVERLADLCSRPKPPRAKIDPILRELRAATRLWTDEALWGQQVDERTAFKCFMRVLKPTVAGYQELGDIAEDIITALLSKEQSVVLLASRGSAKSTLTSMYVAWLLWRDPENETVLIVSRSDTHAKKMLRAIRGYVEQSPMLAELKPSDDQLDAAQQFEVAPAQGKLGMSVSVTTRGVASQITGLRARTIIADDPEAPKDDTVEAVEKLEERLSELQHVRIPGGRILILGTPQTNLSIYGRYARSDAWEVHRALLFTSDELDGKTTYHSRWPSRFSEDDLLSRKRSVSRQQWALHYELDLSETKAKQNPFRLSDLPVLDLPGLAATAPVEVRGGGHVLTDLPRGSAEDGDEWYGTGYVSEDTAGWVQTLCAVDPASGLLSRDAIGVSIVSIAAGGWACIRAAQGVRGATTKEAMGKVANLVAAYRANHLIIEEQEDGLFGSTLSSLLGQRGYPLRFERVKSGGMRKGTRIVNSLSPALASGRLFVSKDVLTAEGGVDFATQYSGLTGDARSLRYDDIIDATAYAVGYFKDVFSADPSEFAAGSRVDYAALARMPLRRRVISEEDLEDFAAVDEIEESTKLKLEASLAIQAEDIRQGVHDAALQRRIEALGRDLAKYRTTTRPRIDYHANADDEPLGRPSIPSARRPGAAQLSEDY